MEVLDGAIGVLEDDLVPFTPPVDAGQKSPMHAAVPRDVIGGAVVAEFDDGIIRARAVGPGPAADEPRVDGAAVVPEPDPECRGDHGEADEDPTSASHQRECNRRWKWSDAGGWLESVSVSGIATHGTRRHESVR